MWLIVLVHFGILVLAPDHPCWRRCSMKNIIHRFASLQCWFWRSQCLSFHLAWRILLYSQPLALTSQHTANLPFPSLAFPQNVPLMTYCFLLLCLQLWISNLLPPTCTRFFINLFGGILSSYHPCPLPLSPYLVSYSACGFTLRSLPLLFIRSAP